MLRPFGDTTLLDIAVEKILASKVIARENFYLAVRDPELIAFARRHNIRTFERSEHSVTTEQNLTGRYEWHDKEPHKHAIKIKACLPFLNTSTIDRFVEHYLNSPHDGLFAVVERKNYDRGADGKMQTPWPPNTQFMNTKLVPPTYEAAHCL